MALTSSSLKHLLGSIGLIFALAKKRYMEGWVKIHRKLMAWQWSMSPNHMALFLHLLLRANHKETKWRTEIIKPGQLLTGRKQLSNWTGLTESQVRTVVKDLKNSGEIDQRTTRHYSVITITKWTDYQLLDQQIASSSPADRQLIATSKNVNNVKNEKKLMAEAWVGVFNDAVGSKFTATKGVCGQVEKLVAAGFTVSDAELVVAHFKQKWFFDEKMRQYLQPSTLFNGKFAERLDMAKNAGTMAAQAQFDKLSKELDLE